MPHTHACTHAHTQQQAWSWNVTEEETSVHKYELDLAAGAQGGMLISTFTPSEVWPEISHVAYTTATTMTPLSLPPSSPSKLVFIQPQGL